MQLKGTVVVGVDGSQAAYQAAAFTLRYIDSDRAQIVLATVIPDGSATSLPHPTDVTTPYTSSLPQVAPAGPDPQDEAEAHELLASHAARLKEEFPDSTLKLAVAAGDPAEKLAELGDDAELLVIGHHGSDQPTFGRIGTISKGLPGHALCTVLVHRPDAPGGRVVVGMDTSEYSGLAALSAGMFAAAAGLPLVVLVGTDPLGDDEHVRAQTDLDLAWLRAEFPGLDVSAEYRTGNVVDLLVEASQSAEMLVLGKRGLGCFAGMTIQLGSTTAQVVDQVASSLLLVSFRDDPRLAHRRLVD